MLLYVLCQNGADNEPQSEPCSANATPVQNKRSMFRAFKLKKSKSLQETVEASESGYENVGSGTHGSGEPQVDPSRELMRKEKFHFHLLPLRFPKSQSNSSVVSVHCRVYVTASVKPLPYCLWIIFDSIEFLSPLLFYNKLNFSLKSTFPRVLIGSLETAVQLANKTGLGLAVFLVA